MKTFHLIAAGIAAAGVAGVATAAPITLTASGTVNSIANIGAYSEFTGVSGGTTFSFSLTYDDEATLLGSASNGSGADRFYDAISSYSITIGGSEIDLTAGNPMFFGQADTSVRNNLFNGFGNVDRLRFQTAPTLSGGAVSATTILQFPLSFLATDLLQTEFDAADIANLGEDFILTGADGFDLRANLTDWEVSMQVIPVPPAAAMGLAGLIGVGVMRRRRASVA